MHGRKRSEYKHRFQDPQVAASLAQKAQQWNALSAKALQWHDATLVSSSSLNNNNNNNESSTLRDDGTEEQQEEEGEEQQQQQQQHQEEEDATRKQHLQLLDKMLRVNPDPLHLWNHRRRLLLPIMRRNNNNDGRDDVSEWVAIELSLTQAGLERNPKAYGAWFQRKWVLQQAISASSSTTTSSSSSSSSISNAATIATATTLISNELGLTELFLQRDERNFHCWNYRRFVVGLELDTTTATTTTTGTTLPGGYYSTGAWSLALSTDAVQEAPVNKNQPAQQVLIGPQIVPQKSGKDSNNNSAAETTTATTTKLNATSSITIQAILQREWDFTQTKIVENFSNFSAFHHRSKLLLLVSATNDTYGNDNDNNKTVMSWTPVKNTTSTDDSSVVQTIAQAEWKLMENIMFTEPDDQTIWWYHRFVVDWVRSCSSSSSSSSEWYMQWLQQQAETIQVLVEDTNEESGGCKWALLGYHFILSRLVLLDNESKKEYTIQLESILNQLIQVDPDRTQRYETMRRQALTL